MNNIIITLCKEQDILQCTQLFDDARQYFKVNNIDQWQENCKYPNEETLKADIESQALFIVRHMQLNYIIACFMTNVQKDETYEPPLITGAWRTSGTKYGVLHRVAVKSNFKGTGLGEKIVNFATENAHGSGAKSIRCDTHADNKSMHKMLIKNGFVVCGNMLLPSGAPRVAYEKIL